VARYVEEELKHQTASRAAFSASGASEVGRAPFASWEALKREVLRLARAALPKTHTGDDGTEEGRAAASALVSGFQPPASTNLGGPVLPVRTVRPHQGVRAVGKVHEVIACDPCLPRETWVTRCGWNFGSSSHLVGGSEEGVTCTDCIKFAAIGSVRKGRKRGPG